MSIVFRPRGSFDGHLEPGQPRAQVFGDRIRVRSTVELTSKDARILSGVEAKIGLLRWRLFERGEVIHVLVGSLTRCRWTPAMAPTVRQRESITPVLASLG